MASALVCRTLPKTTLSTSCGATLDWASAAFEAWTARSVADTSLSEPPYVPKGVRFAARKTISVGMGFIALLQEGRARILRPPGSFGTPRIPGTLRGWFALQAA